jgi:hypothetical protein
MTAKLNSQWIVGFVDGEGCFNLDVHVKKDMRWGLQMQPEFTVVQNEIDIQILHALKDYFKCGSVSVNRTDKHGTRYHYRVKSVKDLNEKIIPFFEKHSLKTKKKIEFITFRKICRLMNQGYHRESLQNFLEIIDLGQNLRVRLNLLLPLVTYSHKHLSLSETSKGKAKLDQVKPASSVSNKRSKFDTIILELRRREEKLAISEAGKD